MMDNDKLYLVSEVQDILRCKKSNVYELVKSGDLVAVTIGAGCRGIRVAGSDLRAFIDSRKTSSANAGFLKKYI